MEIQQQNVLLPSHDVCDESELYYHRVGKRVNFDGYFNLFYIEKRKVYTEIEGLYLKLSLKGYDELSIVHNQTDLITVDLVPDIEKEYTIELPYADYSEGVFWFALSVNEDETENTVKGIYYAEIAEENFHLVNIGIDICTFKREEYITRTLRKLSEKLWSNTDVDVSKHIQIFVIDNGRTLHDCEAVQALAEVYSKRVVIIPNINAGGSGGFTRGMIEILNRKAQESFTHVLLMDDDVIIEPDTLVRLYGFLTTVKNEWKNITVGGILLREECPHILFSAGEWWEDGYTVVNQYSNLDIRHYDNAVCSYLTESGNEYNQYSGWWLCCYSLDIVREDNLPIPFFIHHDDIEYGIRNQNAGIVFLNGINVWHKDVQLGMPGVNMYYDVRNGLIEMAIQNVNKETAIKWLCKRVVGSILRYRYKDVTLICHGIEDFMKGPGWLYRQKPEELHEEVLKKAYRPFSLEALEKQLSKDEYSSAIQQIEEFLEENHGLFSYDSGERTSKRKLLHLITFNGWVLPAVNELKVVQVKNPAYDGYRKKKLVLYDLNSKKVLLFEKKYKDFFKVSMLFIGTLYMLVREFQLEAENYRNNIGELTNKEAWNSFLESH